MNILYGVQGTGNGHISRSREVVRCLKERGHNVDVLVSGRSSENLWDMEDFEPYTVYRGLTFSTRKGKINYVKTALQLNLPQFYYDIHAYNKNNLDLVVTDFEPLSARIAEVNKIPSIGIGHQYAFWHDIPVAGDNFLSRFILKKYAPVDIPIGLHWHHFDQPILPPIVPESISSQDQINANNVLVYLPFEELSDIVRLVQPFRNHDFYIYHALKKAEDNQHLHLRPFSRQNFIEDLKGCSHVICSAGFELVSEALSLGKSILVKPLAGQMEQHSNALALRRLDLAMVIHSLSISSVDTFLNSNEGRRVPYPAVALLISEWLENGQWDDLVPLIGECWAMLP